MSGPTSTLLSVEIVIGAVVGIGLLTLFLMRRNASALTALTARYDAKLNERDKRISELQRELDDARRQISILMMVVESVSDLTNNDLRAASHYDNALINVLATRFTREELDVLAVNVGLNSEDIAGDTARTKALSLYTAARHRRKVTELRRQVRAERPDVEL